tara:strand:- start:147 stop:683 length:537 start_codon:yes stop_codon:yes gene_type:complete
MAITINGSGTVTGLSAGGLPNASIQEADLAAGVGVNTPSFGVRLASNQTGVAQNTLTKIAWDTEDWDTDNAFASNKFTVPAGKGGVYHFDCQACIDDVGDNTEVELRFYKNGSGIDTPQSDREWSTGSNNLIFVRHSLLYNLDAADYMEVYIVHGESGDQVVNAARTYWSGFKLAGTS